MKFEMTQKNSEYKIPESYEDLKLLFAATPDRNIEEVRITFIDGSWINWRAIK